jgi:hypothetical protein
MHVFLLFFSWPDGATWGNVTAMPLCGAVAVVFAFLIRDRLGRALGKWWHRHLGHQNELAEIRDLAAKAHRIAADAYRHQAGTEHPDAPGRGTHEPKV